MGGTNGAKTAYASGAPEFTPIFSGVRVTRSLVLCVCFVNRCLSFCNFSFGHCVVRPSSIYGFWLPLWYIQTLLCMIKSVFGCVVCLCEVILILHYHKLSTYLRDRPFNLQGGYGFLFRSEFFFRTTRELEYLYFFQNLTLDYMTKTLNQIIFFPPPKSEYFFQQHWESEYFFLEKTHTPLQVKWSVPYLHKISNTITMRSKITTCALHRLGW